MRAPGTTVKTRYVQSGRLVARHDEDYDSEPVFAPACVVGPKPSAVVLTDYGRGSVTRESAADWSQFCQRFQIPMFADPKLGRADVWTDTRLKALVLNWDEAVEFASRVCAGAPWSGGMVDDNAAGALVLVIAADAALLPSTEYVIVKRGQYGSVCAQIGPVSGGGASQTIFIPPVLPTNSTAGRQGAGDTYLAAMVAALSKGLDWPLACLLGSSAAGVAVSMSGTSIVSLRDATDQIKGSQRVQGCGPADLRKMGYTIGYTNGCFDLHLHTGHLATISHAASLCDFLFVGVDSDKRVARLKGAGRPVVAAADRIAQLQATKGVFRVFEFDDHEEALKFVRPDVLVKGGDYRPDTVPEAVLLKEWGGRLEIAPHVDVPHTTERLKAAGLAS